MTMSNSCDHIDEHRGAFKNPGFAWMQGARRFAPRRILNGMQASKMSGNAAAGMKPGLLKG